MRTSDIELLIIINRVHKNPLAITRPREHVEIIIYNGRHDAVVLRGGLCLLRSGKRCGVLRRVGRSGSYPPDGVGLRTGNGKL